MGDCTVGKRQSPIAVESEKAIPTVLDPLIFEFYDQPPKSGDTLIIYKGTHK